MRVTTAYFVGAGTVVAAIATGLGGGLLLGNIMSPQQPKHPSSEVTRLERASPQPIPAMTGATQPVPYVATTPVTAAVAEPSAQPQQQETPPQQAQQPQPAQPQVQQASTQAAEPKQPEPNPPAQSTAAAQPAASAEQPAVRAVPEDSLAKARDADLRRDVRRWEDRDRRKAERRQQWVEKRKLRPRGDDDLADVEASVREATESRPVFRREQRLERRELGFFGREAGSGQGRGNLFDD